MFDQKREYHMYAIIESFVRLQVKVGSSGTEYTFTMDGSRALLPIQNKAQSICAKNTIFTLTSQGRCARNG